MYRGGVARAHKSSAAYEKVLLPSPPTSFSFSPLRPLSHLVLLRNSTNKLVEVLEWKEEEIAGAELASICASDGMNPLL